MIRRAALAALLLAAGSAAAEPAFVLQEALPPGEREATRALLDEAARRLPQAWKDALPRPVRLRWREDLPEGVHGRARRSGIQLDRRLLHGWMARGQGDAAADPSARAALAAVLHELAHLYDRSASGGLSRERRLLDLAGWPVAVLPAGRRARNDFRDRSPDLYELRSPREYVAVNLEHYLLDPDYRCRRPALARFFDGRFGRPAAARDGCAAGLPFVQDAMDADQPVRALDPERVFAVDYLLAEGNERAMSRWGHAMLRLVVCAPERARGPDCRLDLEHHLVVSFRAFVEDLQVSHWRGLAGGYPSRLFALPLDQVVDEYTKVELRGLRSLPLALTRTEIAAVAERAAQLHWSYDGRYFFVGNNCAVETWRLLHDAAPRLAALPLASVTPKGLLRRLRAAGVVDPAAVPADSEAQLRQGFYFEPASAHHRALYAQVRDALALPAADARAWLALPPSARADAIERADLRQAAALLVLESAALRRQRALARDELKRRWLGRGERGRSRPGALDDHLRLGGLFSRPASWLEGEGGYGLPQGREREVLRARAGEDAQRRAGNARTLEAQLRLLLPASRRAALDGTEANLAVLGARLRVLALPEADASL